MTWYFFQHRLFPLKTHFDVSSVFFFLDCWASGKSPDKAHWDWFTLIFFFILYLFHLLWQKSYFSFQFASRETRARTHCNYWSTAAPRGCCVTSAPPHNNKENGSEQEKKTQTWQKRTLSHLRRRENRFPAKTIHWEPEAVGNYFTIINGNCGLQRVRAQRKSKNISGTQAGLCCYLLLSRFCRGSDDTFYSIHWVKVHGKWINSGEKKCQNNKCNAFLLFNVIFGGVTHHCALFVSKLVSTALRFKDGESVPSIHSFTFSQLL